MFSESQCPKVARQTKHIKSIFLNPVDRQWFTFPKGDCLSSRCEILRRIDTPLKSGKHLVRTGHYCRKASLTVSC
jgi:hypothetical protein